MTLTTMTIPHLTTIPLIGWPYFYTRKSPNFAFSSSFLSQFIYIFDHVTSASHTPTHPDDIGRALADAPRRFTTILRAYPRFPLSFPYPPKTVSLTFPPRSAEHHRGRAPNYQNSSEIIAQPRKASETFGSLIYSSDNCYVLIYFTFRRFLLYRFLTNFIIIDLAFSLCFPFPDLLKIVV